MWFWRVWGCEAWKTNGDGLELSVKGDYQLSRNGMVDNPLSVLELSINSAVKQGLRVTFFALATMTIIEEGKDAVLHIHRRHIRVSRHSNHRITNSPIHQRTLVMGSRYIHHPHSPTSPLRHPRQRRLQRPRLPITNRSRKPLDLRLRRPIFRLCHHVPSEPLLVLILQSPMAVFLVQTF